MDLSDLRHRLSATIEMTAEAAAISLRHFRQAMEIDIKDDTSPVTVADRETELALRNALAARFPGEAIFGEEFGDTGAGADGDGRWIIDPIDGTKSFITGLPLFGMLMGYVAEGRPQCGVIRMPALGEAYAGARGLGAWLNGQPIRTSSVTRLAEARLFINDADRISRHDHALLGRIFKAGQIRRMGSDCYPHALVAAGRVDAVIDFHLQPYDYLPVAAVVEGAGGVMTDWQGGGFGLAYDVSTITAATPELHAEIMALLEGGRR